MSGNWDVEVWPSEIVILPPAAIDREYDDLVVAIGGNLTEDQKIDVAKKIAAKLNERIKLEEIDKQAAIDVAAKYMELLQQRDELLAYTRHRPPCNAGILREHHACICGLSAIIAKHRG